VSSVNFGYLERFLNGDTAIVLEVLELFRQQGDDWETGLDPENPSWRAVVHTIKGAAGGIGAAALSQACQTAEFGAPTDLPAVRAELRTALAEIAGYVERGGA
jgi:HPt (histidine-containing phosphotransfer) domain-containing protein